MLIRLYLYNKKGIIGGRKKQMPLELIKEYLDVDQELKRFSTQTMIEENVVVPDFKPDIFKVLSVKGNIQVNNQVIENNKFFVEGSVDCLILYQTEEDGIKLQNINVQIPFTQTIEVEEDGNIYASLNTDVEYLDFDFINSRKLNIRGVLGLKGKFIKKEQYPLIRDIKGLEDLQMLRKWIQITTITDKIKDQAMVKEQIDIGEMPGIVEIIKSQARVLEKEITLENEKIMMNGTIEVELIYVGEDKDCQSVEYLEYKMPFAHIIESSSLKEAGNYECKMHSYIEEILTQVNSNEEGKFNILDIEVLIGIEGDIYQDQEIESIIDAYSPSIQTNLEKEKIDCLKMVKNEKIQTTVKEKISTSIEQSGIQRIIFIDGQGKVAETKRQEDQWIVEGVVEAEILYQAVGEEEKYEIIKKEIPFTQVFDFDLKEDVKADVLIKVHHIGSQLLGDDEIELKIVLDMQCQLFQSTEFYYINEIEELAETQEEESNQAKISVYFKQPNDSLWEIAKRYRITMEEIISQNQIEDQENIPNYTPIIIARNSKLNQI